MWLNRAIVHHSCMYAGVYMPVLPGWIFGVRCVYGGGGGKHSLIINFMSILMLFLTFLKTNSRAEAMLASIQT